MDGWMVGWEKSSQYSVEKFHTRRREQAGRQAGSHHTTRQTQEKKREGRKKYNPP